MMASVFLRSLGLVYLCAFVSLWSQILGLAGSQGISPVDQQMQSAREQLHGIERFLKLPTLCWFDASDRSLLIQCGAGASLAAALIFGLAPIPVLAGLWLLYLSLSSVCGVFLHFQWENLLLESGFLGIFLAPWRWRLDRHTPPSLLFVWLLRWLVFRLYLQSGAAKLLSGDAAWASLTALDFHYETQPLPTWLGWYAHQLPHWFHAGSTVFMFYIELAVPFLIFAARNYRLAAAVFIFALQIVIALTGNYCFFNLLTMMLCVALLDDRAILAWVPRHWRSRLAPPPPEEIARALDEPHPAAVAAASENQPASLDSDSAVLSVPKSTRPPRWPNWLLLPIGLFLLLITGVETAAMFTTSFHWPRFIQRLFVWQQPFRSANQYGLFAVMTTSRPEIILEGSDDREHWQAYEFKYKPGDPSRRPRFVAPHQPRLDWQMWFAALSDYRQNAWLVNLCFRLLQGSPPVLSLLEHNPFPNQPSRYIRAMVYQYEFTDIETRRRTGHWWRRQLKGPYCPVLSLRNNPAP